MSVKLVIFTCIILHCAADILNRDIKIYEGVIREIERYFSNGNIVLFYAINDPGK